MTENRSKKWIYLNNEIMIKKCDEFQLEKDKEAAYSYFVEYVNKKYGIFPQFGRKNEVFNKA